MLPDRAEGRVGEEERQQIVVTVLQFLAMDRLVLAAGYQDQTRVPTRQVLDHPVALHGFEFGQPRGGEAVPMAGRASRRGSGYAGWREASRGYWCAATR